MPSVPNNPSFAPGALTPGIVCHQADLVLNRWLENAAPADLTGWLAVHLEKPKNYTGSLVDEATGLRRALRLLSQGPLRGEATVFVLGDGSSITAFRNQKIDLNGLKHHLEEVLYNRQASREMGFYDLSIQLTDFGQLCRQKQPAQPAPAAAALPGKGLDAAVLRTKAFRNLAQGRLARHAPTVLLVDDDHMVTQLLQRALKQCDVTIAHNAQDALAAYGRTAPDLCFLDIGLPDHSGMEVLRLIHACDPEAFIVMLTANSSEDNLTQSMRQGVRGFIAKPFSLAKVTHYLAALDNRPLPDGHPRGGRRHEPDDTTP